MVLSIISPKYSFVYRCTRDFSYRSSRLSTLMLDISDLNYVWIRRKETQSFCEFSVSPSSLLCQWNFFSVFSIWLTRCNLYWRILNIFIIVPSFDFYKYCTIARAFVAMFFLKSSRSQSINNSFSFYRSRY